MIQSLFDDTTVPLLERVAAFTERRHEVLAGNVANVDTPLYQRRDLDVSGFEAALRRAVEARRAPSYTASADESRDLDALIPEELYAARPAEWQNVTFHDGGRRSIEVEMMNLTRNAMLQSAAIQMLNAQMSTLEAVVTERPA